jgi:hypothetical protein
MVKQIIKEAMEKNPLGLKEAVTEELQKRVTLALEAKMKAVKEEDDDDDDEDDDDEDDEEDEDELSEGLIGTSVGLAAFIVLLVANGWIWFTVGPYIAKRIKDSYDRNRRGKDMTPEGMKKFMDDFQKEFDAMPDGGKKRYLKQLMNKYSKIQLSDPLKDKNIKNMAKDIEDDLKKKSKEYRGDEGLDEDDEDDEEEIEEGVTSLYHKIKANRASRKSDDAFDAGDETDFSKQQDKSIYHRLKAGEKVDGVRDADAFMKYYKKKYT